MEQLKLNLDINCEVQNFKYTVGVINDYESQWFVRNNNPEKNKIIMEYLLMYPNTRPLQSNYKHYIYQLRDNAKR
jgi:hypothetical protein